MSPWLTDKELEILPEWMYRQYQLIRDSYKGTGRRLDRWAQLDIDHITNVYDFLSSKPETYQKDFRDRFSNRYTISLAAV